MPKRSTNRDRQRPDPKPPTGPRPKPNRLRLQLKAAGWRIAWMLVAIAVMAAIFPFRTADNAEEVAQVQLLVDGMSNAHHSITSGMSDVEDFAIEEHGFTGFLTETPRGLPAVGLIGQSGDHCIIMHWTAPDIAQVGRLVPGVACDPGSIVEVPIRPNGGYVPGTGPPFDVMPLVYEARTPFWFLGALVVLVWIIIKASLDLFLIALRPDHFFSGD